MPLPSNASTRPALVPKRWQPDGPESQQLKVDVMSSFQDGYLDIDNPDYMALYRKSPLYEKHSKQAFRNHAKAAIADLVSVLANTESTKGEC